MKVNAEVLKALDHIEGDVVYSEAAKLIRKELLRMSQWVEDYQARMHVVCISCGERVGLQTDPRGMLDDAVREHMEHCPTHPYTKLLRENAELRNLLARKAEEVLTVKTRMVRPGDPSTSHAAVEELMQGKKVNDLRIQVLYELGKCQMTDHDLEKIPLFSHFRPSTVGKRRTEMSQVGFVEAVREIRHPETHTRMKIWGLTKKGEQKVRELRLLGHPGYTGKKYRKVCHG